MNKNYRVPFVCMGLGVIIILVLGLALNYKATGVFISTNKNLPIYCVDTNEKKVAITFDASWGDDKTDEILAVLDKYDVKATFFLVGGWVDDNPEKLKELYKKGHEIGNHTNKHPNMDTISKERLIKEIEIADGKIMNLTGERTTLFRCPEGTYNDMIVKTVEETKHYCIQWDVDSIDWKDENAELEYKRVIKNTKPGSIILFHNDGKYTPENLPKIIEKLKGEGYEFFKISDLIYKDNYHLDNTGKQIKNN